MGPAAAAAGRVWHRPRRAVERQLVSETLSGSQRTGFWGQNSAYTHISLSHKRIIRYDDTSVHQAIAQFINLHNLFSSLSH